MGDRANVCVKDRGEKVYLYTHWRGFELPEIVRDALASPAGRNRWDDASYLTRIIFSRMIRDDVMGETGYGIWSSLGDGGNKLIVVDVGGQKVLVNNKEYSFEDFCNLEEATW